MRNRIFTLIILFLSSVGLPANIDEQVEIVARSLSFLDVPYVYGGTDSSGVDCSGLVYLVYKHRIDDIPRRAIDLYRYSVPLAEDQRLQPGDLVFFRTEGIRISHVGIYLGENMFIHAASGGEINGVVISDLQKPYYREHYVFARRVLD